MQTEQVVRLRGWTRTTGRHRDHNLISWVSSIHFLKCYNQQHIKGALYILNCYFKELVEFVIASVSNISFGYLSRD